MIVCLTRVLTRYKIIFQEVAKKFLLMLLSSTKIPETQNQIMYLFMIIKQYLLKCFTN